MNSTAAVSEQYRRKQKFCFFFFFESQQIKITEQAQELKNYLPGNGAKIYCDVVVAQINYPSFKHNTQDSIEQARGRSHEEDSSQIFMLDDMQFRGVLDVI